MPVIAMTCVDKQAHEKTDQLFIYRFEAPGWPARTIVANLTNAYEPGDVAAIAVEGTQLPEAEIVPRKVFGIESPKSHGVTGMDVSTLMAEGRFRDIAEYCIRDVRATVKLYRIWKERLAGIK